MDDGVTYKTRTVWTGSENTLILHLFTLSIQFGGLITGNIKKDNYKTEQLVMVGVVEYLNIFKTNNISNLVRFSLHNKGALKRYRLHTVDLKRLLRCCITFYQNIRFPTPPHPTSEKSHFTTRNFDLFLQKKLLCCVKQ